MNLKKNAVSYVAWMIILLFTGAGFAFTGMVVAKMYNVNLIVAAAGCIFVLCGILYMIYSMTGYIASMKTAKTPFSGFINYATVVERIAMILLLMGGLAVRVMFLSTAGEDAAYYEVSKVSDTNGILVQTVQGSVYYYCMLLHGLFHIVGNRWIAGIWLQIILQLIGAVCLYLAVRKLIGYWAAIITYSYVLFAPSSLALGLRYSPQVLYVLIFAIAMLLFADFLERSIVHKEEYPVIMWGYAGVVGVSVGICAYTDVTGWLLLLLGYYLFMANRKKETSQKVLFRFLVLFLASVFSFFLMLFLDALLSKSSFVRVVNAWFLTYNSIQPNANFLGPEASLDIVAIMVLISLGIFSFWRRRQTERFSVFVFLCLGIGLMLFLGITTPNMSGSYLFYIVLTIVASIGITELFYKEQPEKEKNAENELEVIDMEEEKKNEEVKPRFIESPLPLPKKKPKKSMDYAFIPNDKDMKYDVWVPDSDDYDLKV